MFCIANDNLRYVDYFSKYFCTKLMTSFNLLLNLTCVIFSDLIICLLCTFLKRSYRTYLVSAYKIGIIFL